MVTAQALSAFPERTYMRPTISDLPSDDWDLSRRYPNAYTDWKYEVKNGDTLRDFRNWFIINRLEAQLPLS
jgi:hypothetical protein